MELSHLQLSTSASDIGRRKEAHYQQVWAQSYNVPKAGGVKCDAHCRVLSTCEYQAAEERLKNNLLLSDETSPRPQTQLVGLESGGKSGPSVTTFIQSPTFEGLAVSPANEQPLKSRINTGCAELSKPRYATSAAIQSAALFLIK